jgi:hypothetical protein
LLKLSGNEYDERYVGDVHFQRASTLLDSDPGATLRSPLATLCHTSGAQLNVKLQFPALKLTFAGKTFLQHRNKINHFPWFALFGLNLDNVLAL